MDRNYEVPATRFAFEILRDHPQISYENAVSAAECSGVSQLPRPLFFAAAERLGIRRDESAEAPTAEGMLQETPSTLLLQLDRFREEMAESTTIRDALLQMQRVVRAALKEES